MWAYQPAIALRTDGCPAKLPSTKLALKVNLDAFFINPNKIIVI